MPVSSGGQNTATRLLTDAVAAMARASTGTLHATAQVEGHTWSNRVVVDARFDLDKDRWSAAMTSMPSGKGAQLPERGTMDLVGTHDRSYVRSRDPAAAGAPWVGYRAPAEADGAATN